MKQVRSLCPLWGGGKNQRANLTRIPAGSVGTIRDTGLNDHGVEYVRVKFGDIWCLCAPTVLERLS